MNTDNLYVKIEYRSDVLGCGIFWNDKSTNIQTIGNTPARLAAQHAIESKGEVIFGMWVATPYYKITNE